ncbi:MAG: HigA family addiction module antitoxin [Phycisphaerae bacterium]|nr:HigA family addiction module antitoxin [Phycisphaerae bacterium]
MIPSSRTPTHPGEILREEFLSPLGISQVAFARRIGVPLQRVNEIVRGRRGVTSETAWLFSQALGTTPQFWLTLQTNFNLAASRPRKEIARLRKSA